VFARLACEGFFAGTRTTRSGLQSQREIAALFEFTRLSEECERVEEFGDAFFVGVGETLGDIAFGDGGVDGDEHRLHGGGLFAEGFGPGAFFRRPCFGGLGTGGWEFLIAVGFDIFRRGRCVFLCLALGVLELGSEVADDAAAFFFGPFVVKGDEPFEDFFVGEVDRPAIGFDSLKDVYIADRPTQNFHQFTMAR
jgi:hypothetical protein